MHASVACLLCNLPITQFTITTFGGFVYPVTVCCVYAVTAGAYRSLGWVPGTHYQFICLIY